MNILIRSLAAVALIVLSIAPSSAAISYTGGLLFENFNSLPTSGQSDFYENDSDLVEWGFQREVAGNSGWEGTQIAGSQANNSMNGMHLNAITSEGTSTAGTVGSAGTGSGEQAIYTIASASFTPAMGVEIVNNSASPLKSISISFTQELWRTAGDSGGGDPGMQNIVPAEWGTTDTGVGSSDFLTATTGFTAVPSLDLVSNDPPSPFAVSFLDGNDPANQIARTATMDLSSSPIAVGESFFLRFTDFNDPGRDAAMAIDRFSFSAPGLSLEVNRNTGAMTLTNSALAGGDVDIQGYSITSSIGAVNATPASWKSITNNYDSDSGSGPTQLDPNDEWTILSAQNEGNSDLSEFQFGGVNDGATIAVGQSVVLSEGNSGSGAAWIPTSDENDLMMTILTPLGAEITIPITYTGNDDSPLLRSDLNHDGDINGADWDIFKLYNHEDIASLSIAQQYARGDLDGDGDNDGRDFLVFKSDYDSFGGSGAFSRMLLGVPEPSSMVLLLLVAAGLSASGFRKPATFLALLLLTSSGSYATDLDFTTFTAEGIAGEAGTTWTTTATTAAIDESNSRGNVLYSADSVLGTQVYGTINPGSDDDLFGLVLGYSPLDGTNTSADYLILDWKRSTQLVNFTGNALSDLTPESTANIGLALSRVTGTPSLDETWGHVSFPENPDGGVSELARGANLGASGYPTDSEIAFSVSYTSTNVTVWIDGQKELDVNGSFPEGRLGLYSSSQDTDTPFVFSDFTMFSADNTLTAIVNELSGGVTLKNNSPNAISFNYYELTSNEQSLDSDNWNSLDAQGVGNSAANGDNWDESGGSSDSLLAELYLEGVTTLAPGGELFMANAYDTSANKKDINFVFHEMSSDLFFNGRVEYTSIIPNLPGDFNNDQVVDAVDYAVWRENLGAADESSLNGNGSGGGGVGPEDYDLWRSNYGASGALATASTAAPEPHAALLVGMLVAIGTLTLRWRSTAKLSLAPVRTAVLLSAAGFAATSANAFTLDDNLDRLYRMGEFSGFGASENGPSAGDNGPVGSDIGGIGHDALDAFGIDTGGFTDFIDLGQAGDVRYHLITAADQSIGHPGMGFSTHAIKFDGVDDLLSTTTTINNLANETTPTSQGVQLWAKPAAAGLLAGNRQSLFFDTNNFGGPAITADGKWTQFSGNHSNDTDIPPTSPVAGDTWAHVAQHVYLNADSNAPAVVPGTGSAGAWSSVLYVNGVAVSANNDSNVGTVAGTFVVGADDASGTPANFYSGVLDELEVYVSGPDEFDLFADNHFIASQIEAIVGSGNTLPAGDVDHDGVLDPVDDVNAFVAGWLKEKRLEGFHNDLYVGDWETHGWGDLNLDGRVNLTDAFLLHQALAPSGGLDFGLLAGSTAPEPTSLGLLCAAILLAAKRRRYAP